MTSRPALRVGIGGPVGSGKTALVRTLCERLYPHYNLGVITNDIYTREDADFLLRHQALPEDRILGVETGGCPHTAIREDASMNLAAVAELQERLEKAKLQTVIEEGNKATRQDEAKTSIRELGEAQMAAFNIFNRCRATHMADSRPKHETNKVMVALAYIEERFRDLQLIVKEGHEAGVIGKVKIREAVVDRQMAPPKTGGTTASGTAKAAKPNTGKANLNASLTASQLGQSGSQSAGHGQPPLQ